MKGPSGTLFVDDGGAGGVPVVFAHSGAGSTAHWTAQLAHLRPGRRAVALDLRGHGRSQAPADGDYSVAATAADLAAVVDGLGLERCVLVGHSLGGATCVAYAGAHPDRVAGLLLLDPAGDGSAVPRERAAEFLRALRSDAYAQTIAAYWEPMLEGARPEVRARLLADLRATAPETVVGTLEALLAFDPAPPLSRYAGPRLSVITRCNETPFALHVRAPGVPHRKLEGTSHWLQLDAPDAVNAILDEFLRAVG